MKKGLLIGVLLLTISICVGCNEVEVNNMFTVGVIKYSQKSSLDHNLEGFIRGLQSEGLIVGENLILEVENASREEELVRHIASTFVNNEIDLILAMDQKVLEIASEEFALSKSPLVYSAVTDPISLGLLGTSNIPSVEITGISSVVFVEEQLIMIRELLPEAMNIGVVFDVNDVNSVATIVQYEEKVANYNFELLPLGLEDVSDVIEAMDNMKANVDCMIVLSDTLVTDVLPQIIELSNENLIPVFGSEWEHVSLGCVAAEAIDYQIMGEQVGIMAASILKGDVLASELNPIIMDESQFYFNKPSADYLGITLSGTLLDRETETFDTLENEGGW